MIRYLLFLFSLAVCIVSLQAEIIAYADTFEYEGINYYVIGREAKTVGTAYNKKYTNRELVIPATVYRGDEPYTVIAIGRESFRDLKIESVILPPTVTHIGYMAFYNCVYLKSVDFGDVKVMENWAFANCPSLKSFTFPESLKGLAGNLLSGTHLEQLNYNSIDLNVPSTSEWYFSVQKTLKEVKFGNRVKTIPTGMFKGCTLLTEVSIPDSILSIEDFTFEDCQSAKITLPNSLVSVGEYAFKSCWKADLIGLPDSLCRIDEGAFSGCNFRNDEIVIPEKVDSIKKNAFPSSFRSLVFKGVPMYIEKEAFYLPDNCLLGDYGDKLHDYLEVYIGDPDKWCAVNSGKSIYVGQSWFRFRDPTIYDSHWRLNTGYSRVRNLTLNPKNKEIGRYAFSKIKLDNLRIGQDCIIRKGAFSGAYLSLLCLDGGEIEDLAFEDIKNLHICCLSTTPPKAAERAFKGCNDIFVYVPIGCKEIYKKSEVWRDFYIQETDFADIEEKFKIDYITSETVVKAINLELSEWDCNPGDTLQMTYTTTPSTVFDNTVEWKSSDEKLATVDESGLVTARNIGTCLITANATDGGGASSSCLVSVTPKLVSGIILDKDTISLEKYESVDLKVTVYPDDATNRSLKWRSSDIDIATVIDGLVRAWKVGECFVSATATDGSGIEAICRIVVVPTMVNKLTIDPTEWRGKVGEKKTLKTYVSPYTSTNKTLEFYSEDDNVASVDQNGVMTIKNPGSCNIVVSSTDGSNIVAKCMVVCDTSGIEDMVEEESYFDIYTTQGVLIRKHCNSAEITSLPKGIFILSNSGQVKKIYVK